PLGFRVQAHASEEQIAALEAAGYTVERHEDAEAAGQRRQVEARTAWARGAEVPRHYLTVPQVEEALAALASPPNDGFVLRIQLPHPTWEGRLCHALKTGAQSGAGRVGIYLLGGIHAREWGSPDILVDFARRLASAYRTRSGITLGDKRFTTQQIRDIV